MSSDDVPFDAAETQASLKWWSGTDDLSLLTQVNNDLPFKHVKNSSKAWDHLAVKLLDVPGFGRAGIDSKKASTRFYKLLSDDTLEQRQVDKAAAQAKTTENSAVAYIRDQVMRRGPRKAVDGDESTDSDVVSRKRKAIFDAQDRELELERERLNFEKFKYEKKLEQREKGRVERVQQREDERKRNEGMMALIQQLIEMKKP
ncbi:hypothetical protein DYB32_010742 [Aphanomyces invadans]|uniref:Myb-like domain-containing protein n=1 Tax=Aphanomyces invadans TaxID=157072 RepID=A0A3R6XZI4_9STRA|nr:hypothetical protein DYB32_010742 [Aphanomyces invadans]